MRKIRRNILGGLGLLLVGLLLMAAGACDLQHPPYNTEFQPYHGVAVAE